MSSTPSVVYAERQEQRARLAQELDASHRTVAWYRLLLVILLVGGLLARPGLWLLLPAVIFVVLMRHHSGLNHRLQTARRAAQFYQDGLLRLRGEWMGRGVTSSFVDPQHAYARDLDLFGKASL